MADAITDAMIEAGVKALRERVTLRFPHMDAPTVEEIYLAMEAARQPQLPSDDGLIKALEEIVAKDRTGFGRAALANVAREALSRHKAPLSVAGDDVAPIPMMLFCPKCGLQHIDMPDPTDDWDNPPHKSHKCVGPNGCGTVWRPADVPTEGVAAIQTRGSKDTVFYNHAALTALQVTEGDKVERLRESIVELWHQSEMPGALHEALCMTWEEYQIWANPDARSQSNKVSKPL